MEKDHVIKKREYFPEEQLKNFLGCVLSAGDSILGKPTLPHIGKIDMSVGCLVGGLYLLGSLLEQTKQKDFLKRNVPEHDSYQNFKTTKGYTLQFSNIRNAILHGRISTVGSSFFLQDVANSDSLPHLEFEITDLNRFMLFLVVQISGNHAANKVA